MKKPHLVRYCPAGLLLGLALAGCGSLNTAQPTLPPQPTPSVAPLFNDTPARPPTATAVSTTPIPEVAVTNPTPQPSPTIEVIALYDEKLDPGWSLENSQAMHYNQVSTGAQSGQLALAAQPTTKFGQLFFTVTKQAKRAYERKRVLGVRFWLSGERTIATSDLAITIVGSNQYTYWNPADTSVHINTEVTPDAPLFSETRLYDLGFNRTIPPKTWVQVVVWLDNLIYDPEYAYVTGIYIKNDELFTDTFYLDHMELLLQAQA